MQNTIQLHTVVLKALKRAKCSVNLSTKWVPWGNLKLYQAVVNFAKFFISQDT